MVQENEAAREPEAVVGGAQHVVTFPGEELGREIHLAAKEDEVALDADLAVALRRPDAGVTDDPPRPRRWLLRKGIR